MNGVSTMRVTLSHITAVMLWCEYLTECEKCRNSSVGRALDWRSKSPWFKSGEFTGSSNYHGFRHFWHMHFLFQINQYSWYWNLTDSCKIFWLIIVRPHWLNNMNMTCCYFVMLFDPYIDIGLHVFLQHLLYCSAGYHHYA